MIIRSWSLRGYDMAAESHEVIVLYAILLDNDSVFWLSTIQVSCSYCKNLAQEKHRRRTLPWCYTGGCKTPSSGKGAISRMK